MTHTKTVKDSGLSSFPLCMVSIKFCGDLKFGILLTASKYCLSSSLPQYVHFVSDCILSMIFILKQIILVS